MSTMHPTQSDRKPLIDPYQAGRSLAAWWRRARIAVERSLHPEPAGTSILWEDGEADRRNER